MARKLASIKIINDIKPIPEKDRIELAIFDGWQIIVKKGEYQIGDRAIFVEIDSVLPDKPEFDFLRKNKFRIKTIKLSGVLSQGICFPLSILPQGKEYKIDEDVTDVMGIKKYEPHNNETADSSQNNGVDIKQHNVILRYLFRFKLIRDLILPKKQAKGFPDFISKTDETRIQNIPYILNNKDIKYEMREKIDGQSGTFFLKKLPKKIFRKQKFDFGVCSRNLRIYTKNDSSYWFVAEKYNIKGVLEDLIGDNDFVAIQGECIAPNVQGNKYKVKEPDLFVFNLIFPSGKMEGMKAEKLLKEKYGLKWCPLAYEDFTLKDTVNEMLDFATGTSQLLNTLREGFVLRNYEKNISFKVVSPEFLIKNDE